MGVQNLSPLLFPSWQFPAGISVGKLLGGGAFLTALVLVGKRPTPLRFRDRRHQFDDFQTRVAALNVMQLELYCTPAAWTPPSMVWVGSAALAVQVSVVVVWSIQ